MTTPYSILTVLIFFGIDIIWLGLITRIYYRSRLAHLLAPAVNWPAAIVSYLLFILGLLYFAVVPALAQQSFAGSCMIRDDLAEISVPHQ